jgi:hypothetical protein
LVGAAAGAGEGAFTSTDGAAFLDLPLVLGVAARFAMRLPYIRQGGSPFRFALSSHKTRGELNGQPVAILTTATVFRAAGRLGRLAPAAALACALAGCVDLPGMVFTPPPVELTSPIAKEVQAASAANRPYPKFADVPPIAPPDIRPASAWSRNIYDTLQLRRQQQALAAIYPQTLFGTEDFAQTNQAKATPPAAPSASQTDDYAKTQRERAKPPSPAQ